jgi:hypothetical protein
MADVIGMNNVAFEVNRLLGSPDRIEPSWIVFLGVFCREPSSHARSTPLRNRSRRASTTVLLLR